MDLAKLTPIQQRMFALLSDGVLHTALELHGCLEDELGPVANIHAHITALRNKLRPAGVDILCQRGKVSSFRLVRPTASSAE